MITANCLTLVILQRPSLFFVRRNNKLVVAGNKPAVFIATGILFISRAAETGIGVPFPAPGSLLIKYSAATTFCGAAGVAG